MGKQICKTIEGKNRDLDKERASKSMQTSFMQKSISRRSFLKGTMAGLCFSMLHPLNSARGLPANLSSPLFWVRNLPINPFWVEGREAITSESRTLRLIGQHGLKLYLSSVESELGGPSGMIGPSDVVLIKVNAQWKYRGCTNSDLIRGLVQRILDHPDGFSGEVVVFENRQSQGSLNGDALGWGSYPDNSIHANANDESHSFLYLVNANFRTPVFLPIYWIRSETTSLEVVIISRMGIGFMRMSPTPVLLRLGVIG